MDSSPPLPRTGPEPPLSFRTLHDSPLVGVRAFACRACGSAPGVEEGCETNSVVLLHRGAFRKHFGRRSVTADPNQAAFFSAGSSYRVSHPAACGDRGTSFRVAPRVLVDIVRELDPSVDDHPARPFPFVTGPCDSGLFLRHHELIRRLASPVEARREPLWADVASLQLVADALEAAFTRHAVPRPSRRAGTAEDHAELAEAARAYLARRFAERVTLGDVADAVHSSPFHLARVFQRQAGVPLHRYLTRLRLRAALERLADGETDLADLALRMGFASHAHFTDAFRREFGRTPSDVRGLRRMAGRLQTSKNPKA